MDELGLLCARRSTGPLAINHGDAIVGNDVSGDRVLKMILTLFVPYAVSTSSSVAAMREMTEREGESRRG